jgi:TolB-like protein
MTESRSYQRFFAELKRRKVFRAAGLYGAGAFAVLQLADIVFPAIGLPEEAITWLVALSLVGLPVALVLAWTFDVTSGGMRRTETAETAELEAITMQPRSQRWPAGILALVGIALLMLGSWWVGMRSSGAEAPAGPEATVASAALQAEPVESIAVLPFVNIGGAPEDEPFSDGLTEELGNALAQIDGLRVAARSSAFSFKDRDVDVREVGETLGVSSVVEGSVRRSGGSVRISAQLSRTSDGFRLWSDSWERDLTAANVFAIQDEITADIAGALTRELRPGAQSAFMARRTEDLEAYDLYLLGRHRWATRDGAAIHEAIDYYDQAIARDSGFALAWAGLADAWSVLPFYDPAVPGRDVYPSARAAAERALLLEPDLAEANAARGIIATEYEFDLETGRILLGRATDLNPNYAQAHAWYCEVLVLSGDDEGALVPCRKAVELDPVGLIPNLLLSVPLSGLGRRQEALGQIDRTLALHPGVAMARFFHAGLLLQQGLSSAAAESLEALGRAAGFSDPGSLRQIAEAWPGTEPSPAAVEAVRRMEREVGRGQYYLAALYDWAGSEQEAVRVVEEAVEDLNPWLGIAAVFPEYDGLRDNPDFQAILAGKGLPNGNTAWRTKAASASAD